LCSPRSAPDPEIQVDARSDRGVDHRVDVGRALARRMEVAERPELRVVLDAEHRVAAYRPRNLERGVEGRFVALAARQFDVEDRVEADEPAPVTPADDRAELHRPATLARAARIPAQFTVQPPEELLRRRAR